MPTYTYYYASNHRILKIMEGYLEDIFDVLKDMDMKQTKLSDGEKGDSTFSILHTGGNLD